MIIILIIISIIGIILSPLMSYIYDMSGIFVTGLIIKIIILFALIYAIVDGRVIDQKIELIESKNQEIESKVETSVKAYMDYENETFSDLKVDSYIQLVNLYPDLKSDELIKSEIEMYQKNVEEITELKMEKINISDYKFLVYFGK